MRISGRLPLLTTLGAVALALGLGACGGSGSDSGGGPSGVDASRLGDTGSGKDPSATGPLTIQGAQKGGTVTVLTNIGLTTTLDPSEVYYTDTGAIMSGLVVRSLTQYKYDDKTGQMILVPDLATDLGRPNDSFTKWTFTIRSGVKFEDGTPVTAKNIAWGIQRCMDAATFPTGECPYYANVYFRGGPSYKGPYTAPHQKFRAVKVHGDKLTIFMNKPFPDMPYFASSPAMGPIPLSRTESDPRTYKDHPLATGPYKFKSYSPSKELVLVRNPEWDPSTDPGRTQYPDGYDFKTQQPSERIDQIMLADSGSGQTTLTYDNLLAPDYNKLRQSDPSRLVTGGTPCTFYWGPDNQKITDKKVREALSWAFPYKDVILASGRIIGVTAIPATNLMPPGIPGRTAYNITGRKGFQTDPAKARALLKSAGKLGYPIKFLFRTDDDESVKTKDVEVKALDQAGFKAVPVPTTIAGYSTIQDNPDSDINVRSAGWCSDWPSGATWIPPIYGSTHVSKTHSLGVNDSVFSNASVDKQILAVQKLPLAQQPAAWDKMDKQIMQKYFPLFPTYYGGAVMARGSKIMGDHDDPNNGQPTFTTIWVKQ